MILGQGQANEGQVKPVVRKLVDIEGLVRFALDCSARQELPAEVGQRIGGQIGQCFDPATRVALRIAPEAERQRRNIGQFHRAFDRTMACQNLLDQR